MIRQASDLVSKFVGETEQNMAAHVRRGRDRAGGAAARRGRQLPAQPPLAERNYEVTEVNEMLQGMERFAGIFICTTNLFEDLDEAALRRFTFKIQFKPLTPEQRERMFVAEALGGDAARADRRAARSAWRALDQLAPGDFAAVKRQVDDPGRGLRRPTNSCRSSKASTGSSPRCVKRRGIGFLQSAGMKHP